MKHIEINTYICKIESVQLENHFNLDKKLTLFRNFKTPNFQATKLSTKL
jgi:hypothetical protein